MFLRMRQCFGVLCGAFLLSAASCGPLPAPILQVQVSGLMILAPAPVQISVTVIKDGKKGSVTFYRELSSPTKYSITPPGGSSTSMPTMAADSATFGVTLPEGTDGSVQVKVCAQGGPPTGSPPMPPAVGSGSGSVTIQDGSLNNISIGVNSSTANCS